MRCFLSAQEITVTSKSWSLLYIQGKLQIFLYRSLFARCFPLVSLCVPVQGTSF